ncbi:hypothetical protein [Devosia sp.]|uniref:hypothetical protein n=1 Tax=Devosia sp. TaxID=1871048 RepID=UPI002FCAF29F
MSLITAADFIDLYLGDDFADVKGLQGAGSRRVLVPAPWAEEIEALRQQCQSTYQALKQCLVGHLVCSFGFLRAGA